MQYERNDVDFSRGNFRVRGDTIEIIPVYEEHAIRIEMFGDEIEALYSLHPLTGDVCSSWTSVPIFPATHYAASTETMQRAIGTIQDELERAAERARVAGQAARGAAAAHAHQFDLEMMEQIGFCSGIENYSRHIDGRAPGRGAALPARLLPRRLPRRDRRVARDRAADRGDVRGRRVAQAHARRARLPAAERARQPAAAVGRVQGPRRPDGLPLRDAGPVRDGHRGRRRRADHPPDRPHRPADRRQAVEGADRRPARRDPGARPSATSACSSRR